VSFCESLRLRGRGGVIEWVVRLWFTIYNPDYRYDMIYDGDIMKSSTHGVGIHQMNSQTAIWISVVSR
jgi:hypothetical protein